MTFTGTGTRTLAAPAAPAVHLNTERKPAEWLAKRFLAKANIVAASKVAGPFPSLSENQALAMATFALLKLRTAQLGKAGATGTDWNAEVTEAQTFADVALAAVSATQYGFFPTAQRILTWLTRFVTNAGLTYIPDPTALPTNWYEQALGLHAPVAGALAYSVAHTAAIDINLLSGVTEADLADTLAVTSINGHAAVDGQVYNVPLTGGGTLALTFHAGTNHLSGPITAAQVVPAFPVTVSNGAYLQNLDRNTGDNVGQKFDTVPLANTTTVTRQVTITIT